MRVFRKGEFKDIDEWLNAQFPWPKGYCGAGAELTNLIVHVADLRHELSRAESELERLHLVLSRRDAALKGLMAKEAIQTMREKKKRKR